MPAMTGAACVRRRSDRWSASATRGPCRVPANLRVPPSGCANRRAPEQPTPHAHPLGVAAAHASERSVHHRSSTTAGRRTWSPSRVAPAPRSRRWAPAHTVAPGRSDARREDPGGRRHGRHPDRFPRPVCECRGRRPGCRRSTRTSRRARLRTDPAAHPGPLGGTRRGHEHRQNLCAARCHQNCPMFGIWNVCAVGVGAFEVCLSNSGRSGCSARTAHSWISSMSSPVAQCTSGAMSR